MISFIVIGKNEGWKLTKCLQSVHKTIEYNALTDYEIIYVDSKSTDDSIERVKKFTQTKIFQLTGDVNAAIARNIGGKEARGNVYFFIDGDMELIPDFLSLVYSEQSGLIRDFVSGNFMDYYYNKKNEFISKSSYLKINEDVIEKVTGGLFLIKRNKWEEVGGMRNIFKKSQDIDLGLRLAKKKTFLYRKKEIAANHHTISYMDKNRMWEDFFKWNHLYGRSLLYRKNIFNKYMYPRLFRNDYSMLVLVFISILFLITTNYYVFIFYFFVIILRSKMTLNRMLFFILRDFTTFLGFFLFWPVQKWKSN